jgi:hypothetical protein
MADHLARLPVLLLQLSRRARAAIEGPWVRDQLSDKTIAFSSAAPLSPAAKFVVMLICCSCCFDGLSCGVARPPRRSLYIARRV